MPNESNYMSTSLHGPKHGSANLSQTLIKKNRAHAANISYVARRRNSQRKSSDEISQIKAAQSLRHSINREKERDQ